MIAAWRRPRKSGAHTPLVVLLHGRGADEHDLLDLADHLPREFTYASVRGPIAMSDGGFTWFENDGIARPVRASLEASVAAIRAWLDAPQTSHPSQRCYVLGFSAGMMMAGALVLAEPRRFAGAILLSGALFTGDPNMTAGRLTGVPIFYGSGSADDVIPAELVARTEAYLRESSGAELSARTYPHGHAISHAETVDIATWFRERE